MTVPDLHCVFTSLVQKWRLKVSPFTSRVSNGNSVFAMIKEINFVPRVSSIFPESDPTTTERGRGRETCAVVYYPSTKTFLDWTLKPRPDM
jgi:hypothetical protein